MENKIDVLDHGFVRLVDHMGSDLSIVRAARVSYNADWRAGENDEGDRKLIKYLWENQHTTPFEAATLTFEVKAPIFVLRQWHRHRTQSYNELSARYKELPNEYYTPKTEDIGKQSTKNKQGRNLEEELDQSDSLFWYRKHCDNAFVEYKQLLDYGWPRELARMVLPLSTYSHMFTTMNLLNFLKFLHLRCDSHAQYEIREYAEAMRALVLPLFPVTMNIFITNEAK